MTDARVGQMKLGWIFDGAGSTAHGWRRPDVDPAASVDIAAYAAQAKVAEAALLDFIFIADTLFIGRDAPPHQLNRLEPISLLSALAMVTSRIGLVATVSTLFTEPFQAARQLASLDLISDGRAAWNIVTSALPGAALNHSQPQDFGLKDRYDRAAEHVEICRGLWDSWEDDAFAYDKAKGVFYEPAKLHSLDHRGTYFQVAGPLNIQRSRQGHPVLFQAGASNEGRDLAARFGDAIFAMTSNMAAAKAYADDVRERAAALGRSREDIVFMARMSPIVGRTAAEAEEKYRAMTQLSRIEDALAALSIFYGGHDFTRHALDQPFPQVGDAAPLQASGPRVDTLAYIETSSPEAFSRNATERGLTLREAALEFATPRTEFVGAPETVVEAMTRWFTSRSCDGFIIRGGDFEAFAELCLPILQARGLYRTVYEADTLRGLLGLKPVPNRYSASLLPLREKVSAEG